LISPGLLGHESTETYLRDETGGEFPADLSGKSLRVSVHPAYLEQYPYVWQALRRTLEEGGIKVQISRSSMAEILDEVDCGRVDLVVARRLAAYPDPDAFVNIFHSVDGLFGNLVGSQQIDRLIETGRSETDPAQRHIIYRELERLLREEALIVPLFDEQIYCLAQPEVRGLRLRLAWPRIANEELEVEE
jgi:peptide/nickel transport system substrate-binding protein